MPIILYVSSILVFIFGLYGVIIHRNMLRIVLSFSLMESATFMLLVIQGFRLRATAPIFSNYGEEIIPGVTHVVDPIVQALTLTSIVIGVATLAMALAIVIQIVRHTHTLDVRRLRDLRG
jgi:multicomponent Na+:H+ antiporter subunit C